MVSQSRLLRWIRAWSIGGQDRLLLPPWPRLDTSWNRASFCFSFLSRPPSYITEKWGSGLWEMGHINATFFFSLFFNFWILCSNRQVSSAHVWILLMTDAGRGLLCNQANDSSYSSLARFFFIDNITNLNLWANHGNDWRIIIGAAETKISQPCKSISTCLQRNKESKRYL